MIPFLAADPLEHVLPHPLFGDHLVWFTNQSFMALVAAGLMLLIFPKMFAKPDSAAPTGAKNFFESILEYLRIEVFRPALKENTDAFVPFLWTVFFFIAFCNILGCIPFTELFDLITGGHIPHLGGTATGSINTTLTLAICAFIFIHFNGLNILARKLMNGTYGHHEPHNDHSANGGKGREPSIDLEHMRGEGLPADVPGDLRAITDPVAHYKDDEYPSLRPRPRSDEHAHGHQVMSAGQAWMMALPLYIWNFAPHTFRPQEGESQLKWLIDIPFFLFLLVLETVGAFIKPFALCMRLFANMVAGHVVLAVLISLIVAAPSLWAMWALGIPIGALNLAIQFLELFVALLQAYIFTFLTTLFVASAVAPEH